MRSSWDVVEMTAEARSSQTESDHAEVTVLEVIVGDEIAEQESAHQGDACDEETGAGRGMAPWAMVDTDGSVYVCAQDNLAGVDDALVKDYIGKAEDDENLWCSWYLLRTARPGGESP
jgi:hypothetical protein